MQLGIQSYGMSSTKVCRQEQGPDHPSLAFLHENLTWTFSPRHQISEGTWEIGFFEAVWEIGLQLDNEVLIKCGLRNGKQRKNYHYLSLAFSNKSILWK